MIDLKPYAATLENKKAGVFGLGLSGLAAVRALVAADIKVFVWDDSEVSRQKAEEFGAIISDLAHTLDDSFDFLVLSPGVPLTHPEPHNVVKKADDNGVEIIGDMELLHRSSHGLKTIGITGTNGKSTTTALMAHVLNECGVRAIAAGNIGNAVLDLDITDTDILVLEMSSYQLDLCPNFHPDISVLLNITPDHLDRHGDMQGYSNVKAKIFEGEGLAVVGVDDEYTKKIAEKVLSLNKRNLVSVSVKNKADVFVKNGVLYNDDRKIGLLNHFETLKGEHNHQNVACVFAVSSVLGLEYDLILKAMESYAGLAHRQYMAAKIGSVTYINDSKATNVESAAKALSSYDNIFWIVGGRAKEGGLIGLESFAPKIKKAYLVGEAAHDFEGWFKKNKVNAVICNTLDKAALMAHKDAQDFKEHSTVLLAPACASWDQFKSFEDRGNAFMDIVKKIERGAV